MAQFSKMLGMRRRELMSFAVATPQNEFFSPCFINSRKKVPTETGHCERRRLISLSDVKAKRNPTQLGSVEYISKITIITRVKESEETT